MAWSKNLQWLYGYNAVAPNTAIDLTGTPMGGDKRSMRFPYKVPTSQPDANNVMQYYFLAISHMTLHSKRSQDPFDSMFVVMGVGIATCQFPYQPVPYWIVPGGVSLAATINNNSAVEQNMIASMGGWLIQTTDPDPQHLFPAPGVKVYGAAPPSY